MVLGTVVDRLSEGIGYKRFVLDLLRRVGVFRMKLGATTPQDVDMSEVQLEYCTYFCYE